MDKVFGSVYCLLEKKDKNIYCKIFSFILHWAVQHGHTLTIKNEKGRIKTDLGKIAYSFGHFLQFLFTERAVYLVAKEVLGDSVEPDTCQFHFTQVRLC